MRWAHVNEPDYMRKAAIEKFRQQGYIGFRFQKHWDPVCIYNFDVLFGFGVAYIDLI